MCAFSPPTWPRCSPPGSLLLMDGSHWWAEAEGVETHLPTPSSFPLGPRSTDLSSSLVFPLHIPRPEWVWLVFSLP